MKTTAIEWLEDNLNLNLYTEEDFKIKNEIFEQAKEIEKQQIIDAFDVACEDENRIGQEYYNQTFNK
jgi:hypothetical protein